MVTVAPLAEVWQSPLYTIAPEGGYIDITCCASGTLHGVYLKQRWPSPANVVYYEDGKEPTVSKRFWGRIAFSGLQHNLTITMSRLQPADTGVYACQAILKSEVWGPGTMVVVTGREPTLRPLHLPAGWARLHRAVCAPPSTLAKWFL